MEDLDVEAAEKDSYADCPDSSTGSELKAVEEPALSGVEGSKGALNPLANPCSCTCSCSFGILDHFIADTSTRTPSPLDLFAQPEPESFRNLLVL